MLSRSPGISVYLFDRFRVLNLSRGVRTRYSTASANLHRAMKSHAGFNCSKLLWGKNRRLQAVITLESQLRGCAISVPPHNENGIAVEWHHGVIESHHCTDLVPWYKGTREHCATHKTLDKNDFLKYI